MLARGGTRGSPCCSHSELASGRVVAVVNLLTWPVPAATPILRAGAWTKSHELSSLEAAGGAVGSASGIRENSREPCCSQ